MCLTIKSGPHVAKGDIFTLKMGESVTKKSYRSYYQLSLQKYGVEYKSRLKVNTPWVGDSNIDKGLHSLIGDSIWIHTDFRDFRDKRGIILCKIPKGATYYIGIYNDIVSDKLTPIEPLVHAGGLLEEDVIIGNGMTYALTLAISIAKSYGYKIGL